MNFQVSLMMTGAVVIAGRWVEGDGLDASVAVGAVIVILMLFAVDSASPHLANAFGGLILVGALLRYTQSIVAGKKVKGLTV